MSPAAPYGRTLGAILAFGLVALFVKYADLLLTYELQPEQLGLVRRVWLALRFSWQEFAIVAVLVAIVLAWQRRAPSPGRGTRAALATLRFALVFGAAVSVAGIKYYGLYHGHMLFTDFAENITWALQLAASADVFESPAITAGAALGAAVLLTMPWLGARLRPVAVRRLGRATCTLMAAMAGVTWMAGRPPLVDARLEPNPLVWFVWGPYATFFDLPPVETLTAIGPQQRLFEVTRPPRNLILVVLESIPASALYGYNPEASAGRRLFEQYGDDITRFDEIYAVVPISDSTILSLLTGWSPVPSNAAALKASAGRPTLGEIFRDRGYYNQFLLTGPRNALIAELVDRGFDRALYQQSVWPNDEKYVRLAWGPDDRVMFDDVGRFLASRPADAPPFLLVMYTNNAHHPYQSGLIPGLRDDPDPRVRHALLTGHVLELLTDLYGSLKTSGLAESTLVIAFGDHGQAFGEHRGNYVHAKELFRENMHAPMLLLHPGRLGLPARISQLGSVDDVMPTVLDIMGFPAPPGSGMSLLNEAPNRTLFQMTPFGPGVVGFRNREFLYTLSRTGRELLFDLAADPSEQHNVADLHPDVVAGFRRRLEVR